MKVKESEKVGLKLNIQKTMIMASDLITSWHVDGETMELWETLFWGAPKSLQMMIAAMKLKEENETGGLKLNIQKTKITASGPITSWQIDGETMETVRDFILGGSKITADGDCSHEIKRCLLLEEKLWLT